MSAEPLNRPLLLDLFCCEGGAARGYHAAGFDVVGVDWNPARGRHYPYPFLASDVFDVLATLGRGDGVWFYDQAGQPVRYVEAGGIDVVHASPDCQGYSITQHTHAKQYPRGIGQTRAGITSSLPDVAYVIENVYGARNELRDPLMLCGSEFGLTATDTDGRPLRMERHRLFECSEFLMGAGGCQHDERVQVAGAYGGGSVDLHHARTVRRGGYTPRSKSVRAALLGLPDTMTVNGLSQSIPPAYTEHIGSQLLDHLAVVR